MMEGLSTNAPAFLLLGLVVAGALSGLLAGLFGIGGGAITVPVLYEIFGIVGVDEAVRMHLAVGSSLAVIVPTSVRSFFAHRATGQVDEALLRSWTAPVILGVLFGVGIAAIVNGAGLRSVFAGIALVMALKMLFGLKGVRLGEDIPHTPLRSLYGIGVGLFSTLMGIGGGILCNAVMTLYSRPLHQAVATSSGVGILIALPGALGMVIAGYGRAGLPPLSFGFVNVLAAVLIAPLSILCAPIGARITHGLPRRQLEIAFGLFLLTVAARYILSLI